MGFPSAARQYYSQIVATTTLEAAKDLKEKLAHHYGKKIKSKVRTMPSILVNGFHEGVKINLLTVDEDFMNHFGLSECRGLKKYSSPEISINISLILYNIDSSQALLTAISNIWPKMFMYQRRLLKDVL
ncbi:unnamed protein product [Euphydryas editha]|uniref:Uncharacterized protein n=1 Tax=Euphydryas editha TaxID=104508 RepID=A0AAU9TP95_EUPED|nr:unnamed protein product [Euphydryas editha]